jgi:hypothetical protein
VQYHMEIDSGKLILVGINDGLSHELIHDIVLTTTDGRKLKEESGAGPYILAGSTRRWPIAVQGSLPQPGETLQLIAHSDAGAIEQPVGFVTAP